MSIIQWRKSYNTGVEQFDNEHRKIVELIGVLFTCIRENCKNDEVAEVVTELVRYTEYHFSNEEQAMEEADYPELGAHIEEHLKLKEQVIQFQALGETIEQEKIVAFYHFLRNWLVNHIVGSDKKYGDLLAPK